MTKHTGTPVAGEPMPEAEIDGFIDKHQTLLAKLAVDEEKERTQQREAELAQASEHLVRLQAELKARDEAIRELADKLDERWNAYETCRVELRQANDRILVLQSKVDTLEGCKLAALEQAKISNERIQELEVSVALAKAGWNQAKDRIAELECELATRSRLTVRGTDGCVSCDTGRITLFVSSSKCIECAPDDYVRVPDQRDETIRVLEEALVEGKRTESYWHTDNTPMNRFTELVDKALQRLAESRNKGGGNG